MKAEELRIGNLIQWISTDRIEKVQDITTYDKHQAVINRVAISDCKPIPLTEGWLLKFGFIKIGNNYQKGFLLLHTNLKTGTIDFLLNEPYSRITHATVLRCVHQLQNLYFALTGEELKYVL